MLTVFNPLDNRAGDQTKSSAAAGNVELALHEVPQQEVGKSTESSIAVAQEILGCHSALAVSVFCTRILALSCRVLLS